MNARVLKTLEYNKIIDKLSEHASSDLGKKLCKNLLPLSDIEEIRNRQKETSDALRRIFQKGSLSFSGLKDIGESLKRLSIGSVLGMGELLYISSSLNVTTRAKSYSRGETDEGLEDSLDAMFEALSPLTPLNNELKKCIISEEEMSDDASPTLKSIRRSMITTNDKIHSQLTSMVNSTSTRSHLQENVITMRNGRYCLPVKQEYRSKVPGMIHDQSSTGSTIFIEPMAVVKLNNDLKELSIKENDEIEKILATLSNLVSLDLEALEENMKILPVLDFIFAKASLSKFYHASEPIFNDQGIIHIKQATTPF